MKNSPEYLNAYAKILSAYEVSENDVDENIGILLGASVCRNVDEAADFINKAIVKFSEEYKYLPTVCVAVNAMLEDIISRDLSSVIGKKIEFVKGFLTDFTDETANHVINYINSQPRDYNVLDDTRMLPVSRHFITINLDDVHGFSVNPSI